MYKIKTKSNALRFMKRLDYQRTFFNENIRKLQTYKQYEKTIVVTIVQ